MIRRGLTDQLLGSRRPALELLVDRVHALDEVGVGDEPLNHREPAVPPARVPDKYHYEIDALQGGRLPADRLDQARHLLAELLFALVACGRLRVILRRERWNEEQQQAGTEQRAESRARDLDLSIPQHRRDLPYGPVSPGCQSTLMDHGWHTKSVGKAARTISP